ncbi:uracil-DNA glycosylase [Limnohabitans sp. T6-20]|uniref:uracil-DNA glycosylase n=1 Tax=Limnohabitans sp. T6-20 TaxID=1100725 RepID=UPI000D33FD95|nr:uracil-DNA glycosylase [Limnohabitans sp. T6-20]PUE12374.1 uracil-DNA glycosylase [Limnohabitans sp. T6-20]
MSDPTRFDLDERQRAMLAEMGVRVWWPQAQVQVQPEASALPNAAPVVSAPPVATPMPPLAPVATPAARPAPALPVQAAVVVTGKPLADGVDRMDWASLQDTAAACQACDLCGQRKKSVFGVGDVQADWMVIGDPPGEDEEQQGEPFAGQAGQLLDNMLKAVGLARQAHGEGGVYITNAVKCRPPGRNPTLQELSTCAPYLARQVALVQPKVIVVMGRFAVQSVLQSSEPLGKLRGQLHTFQGIPVVATYHPSSLLRTPADKAKAWVDLLLALKAVRGQ